MSALNSAQRWRLSASLIGLAGVGLGVASFLGAGRWALWLCLGCAAGSFAILAAHSKDDQAA